MKKYLKIVAVFLVIFSLELLYLNYSLNKKMTTLEQNQKQARQKISVVEVESKKALIQISKTNQTFDRKLKKAKQKMNPEEPNFELMLVAN